MPVSSTDPAAGKSRFPKLSRKAWMIIAIAFGAGLLLFLLLFLQLLSRQAEDSGFYHAGNPQGKAANNTFEPLPTPDAAASTGQDSTRPQGEDENDSLVGPEITEEGQIEETLPPPDLPPAPPAPAAMADASARPLDSPRPQYPAQAMRRGERGEVLLQVEVDADGRPVRVDVVQSSRSRALDREAVRAVQNWTFSPAIRGGRPVSSKVLIPIEFN